MNELNSKQVEKISNYWLESSQEDFETMLIMYQSKRYSWALFVGHLALEKLLKGFYVKKHKKNAPFIHNLYRLAELNEFEVSEEMTDWLFTVTSFNLNARYEDYKKSFYKKCTLDFTNEWIEKIKKIRLWIKEMR